MCSGVPFSIINLCLSFFTCQFFLDIVLISVHSVRNDRHIVVVLCAFIKCATFHVQNSGVNFVYFALYYPRISCTEWWCKFCLLCFLLPKDLKMANLSLTEFVLSEVTMNQGLILKLVIDVNDQQYY